MTCAHKLHILDAKKRKKHGWDGHAFIAPKFPDPKTETEKAVRELADEELGLDNTFHLHIYDVVEAMELAYELGKLQQSH